MLDSLSRQITDSAKRQTWINDQFFNPHETTHTPFEVFDWLNENDLEFLNLWPHLHDGVSGILEKKDWNSISKLDDFFLLMDTQQIKEGGFFVMVAQKK